VLFLEKMLQIPSYIDVATECSKNHFNTAYKLNQVSSSPFATSSVHMHLHLPDTITKVDAHYLGLKN
jgi:hypothetical protein